MSVAHPTVDAAADLVVGCRTAAELRRAHAALLRRGWADRPSVSFKLQRAYAAAGDLRRARAVFDSAAGPPTVFAFSALIDACATLSPDPLPDCLLLYLRMLRLGVPPNAFTFSSLFKSAAGPYTDALHAHAVKLGLTDEPYVCTSLLESYARGGGIGDGNNNNNNNGYDNGDIGSARRVFEKMRVKTLVCATSLICCYVGLGELGEARAVFDGVSDKDAVVWSVMIYGYAQHGQPGRSLELFRGMLLEKKVMLIKLLNAMQSIRSCLE